MLNFSKDSYNGIHVDFDEEENQKLINNPKFQEVLTQSLSTFSKKYKCMWVRLSKKYCVFISFFLTNGFDYHHAQKEYVMMTKWFIKGENKIPEYSRASIGVGGMVVDFSKKKILLIVEKYFRSEMYKDVWKLPGGALDSNEKLAKAAIREVKEETGVVAEYFDLLGFRHLNNFRFKNQDDFYYLFLLTPSKLKEEQEIKIDPKEIAQCEWVDLDRFFKMEKEITTTVRLFRDVLKKYVEDKSFEKKKKIEVKDISHHGYKQIWYGIK